MKYRVTAGPFGVPAGFVLNLHDEQAAPRLHRLQRREDGAYDVMEPVEFKAGEEVEIVSGDLGRYGETHLEAVEGAERREAPMQPHGAGAGADSDSDHRRQMSRHR